MSDFKALSEQEVVEYVRQLPNLFGEGAKLVSREIGDGNINFVYHIVDESKEAGGRVKSVIVKQALPYVRSIGATWPLSIDRARIESEALQWEGQMAPGLVPEVYHFNRDLALVVMEDLTTHIIMRRGLIEGRRYPKFAQHIGVFLAKTLFRSSDLALDGHAKKSRLGQFINPDLCHITEKLIFTDPYHDSPDNSFNPLIRDTVEELWSNNKLLLENAKLKEAFLSRTQSLLHGDLHTGSIMITADDTKVIDPEFAYYGPMGFDIGAVFANLLLNYAAQIGHMSDAAQRLDYQTYLLNTIEEVWTVFEREFRQLWESQAQEPTASAPGYKDDYILRVLRDTIGYTGSKMIRRVVGLSHVADLESIADTQVRAEAERLVLLIAQRLIVNRNSLNNIQDMLKLVVA